MRISVTDIMLPGVGRLRQAQIKTAGQDYTSSLQRDSKRMVSLWTSVVTSVFVDILKLSHSTVVLCRWLWFGQYYSVLGNLDDHFQFVM